MKRIILNNYCFALFFFLPSMLCQGQEVEIERKKPLPEEKLAESRMLTKKIIADIEKLGEHSLAGEYSFGGGLSNCKLIISPTEGYVYSSCGDIGLYHLSYGKVFFEHNRVELLSEFDYAAKGGFLTKQYTIVPWAGRRYLVSDDRMLEFCNDVNAYKQVYGFLLKKGDSHKDVGKTLPEVPKDSKRYLLKNPVQAEVIKVGKSEIVRDGQSIPHLTTKVVINKGKINGLNTGMQLFVFSPPERGIVSKVLKIASVTEAEAEGILMQEYDGKKTPIPKEGWKLSTSAP